MTKILKALLALSLCLATLFVISSCNLVIGGPSEGSFEMTADGKEDSLTLLNDYFADTFNSQGLVVHAKDANGDTVYDETIVDTSDFTYYATTGANVWSYKNADGTSIVAFDVDGSKYYFESDEYYTSNYGYYKNSFDMLNELPEDSGTFTCVSKGTDKTETINGESVTTSNSTLSFKYATSDSSFTIEAESVNDVLVKATLTRVEPELPAPVVLVLTFSYDDAEINLPDITDWAKYE